MVKANSFTISEFPTRFYYNLFTQINNMNIHLTNWRLSTVWELGVVAWVLTEAVERGDEDVGDEFGLEGGVGAEVGDVRNLKPFILLEDEP